MAATNTGRGSSQERLEAALQAGQVTPLDGGCYRCEVCNKAYASKASVKTHLSTKTHLSKLPTSTTTKGTSQGGKKTFADSSDQCHSLTAFTTQFHIFLQKKKDNADYESSQKRLETVLQVGHVTPLDGGRYRCEACDKEYASKATVRTHLSTNLHLNKLSSLSFAGTASSPVRRSTSASPSEELLTLSAAKTTSQDVKRETLADSSDQKVKDGVDCEKPQERLEAALQVGLVTLLHGGAYKCKVCDKEYVSKATIKPHLYTVLHYKKLQNFSEKNLVGCQMKSETKIWSDGKQLTYSGPGCCLPAGAEDLPGHLAAHQQTTSRSEAEAMARLFRETRVKQVELEYPLDRQLRPGRVDVFNYIYFHYNTRQRLEDRKGARMDSINLQHTFTRLGYQVHLHENLTEMDTFNEIENIKKACSREPTQALFVFFLSHGVNSKEFLAADGKPLNIDSIRNEFITDRCPALAKKPKIFMTNYCRGKDEEWMETDGRVKVPRDIVTIYASKDGIVAYRLPEEGTSFVLSLCEVIENLTERTELRHVYHLLSEKMKKKKATSPIWEDFSFKKFFLEIPNGKS